LTLAFANTYNGDWRNRTLHESAGGIYMGRNYSTFLGLSSATRDRLYANLSSKPYCSNNLQKQGLKIRPKDIAFERYAYLQLNNHWSDTYLIFDVDRSGAALEWDLADILAPTFITINPLNGHAHLVYELRAPVWKQGSEKPIKWTLAIKKGLTEILGADFGYTGLISKNPNHRRWEILDFGGRHELIELWETVEVHKKSAPPPAPVQSKINHEAQSNFLFHSGRFYGYWVVRQCATHSMLCEKLSVHLENGCIERGEPIKRRQIDYYTKYIADWVWERRDKLGRAGRHKRKTTDSELKQRQIQSAHNTAEIKRAATEATIKKAVEKFLREGRKITKAAIAREAGISREAASRYYSHLIPKV
jgi:hypothetical protein